MDAELLRERVEVFAGFVAAANLAHFYLVKTGVVGSRTTRSTSPNGAWQMRPRFAGGGCPYRADGNAELLFK